MSRVDRVQSSFTRGILSPRIRGRIDFEGLLSGAEDILNGIVMPQGGVTKRPGTRHVAEVKTSTKAVRLVPFVVSNKQAYVIELGDQYARFYTDDGQLTSGGSPVEISTPWTEAQLDEITWTQSADILYLAHPSVSPREIQRDSVTSFSTKEHEFVDGPFQPLNDTSTTLTPSSTSGTVTFTASATTGINGGAGFQSTDVGRLIRFEDSNGDWHSFKITVHNSTTSVDATLETGGALPNTNARDTWRLGEWSDTSGWPRAVGFHAERLWWGGTDEAPQTVWGSEIANFPDHSPSDDDGTVVDTNAINVTISNNTVNTIRWFMSASEGLLIGTQATEMLLAPATTTAGIAPGNVVVNRQSSHGSKETTLPIFVSKSVVFVQRDGHTLNDYAFNFDVNGFDAQSITVQAEHLFRRGIKRLTFQQAPEDVIWALTEDGVLAGMTVEKAQRVFGWHRHLIADASAGRGELEDIAVIPEETKDRLWLVMKRTIDGATKRYVSFLEDYFDGDQDIAEGINFEEDVFFVDSGLSLDAPVGVPDITQADPGVVTTFTAHGFSNGDRVRLRNTVGMPEVDGGIFVVANKTSTTFELTDLDGNNVDTTDFGEYEAFGNVRKEVTTISGLDHLEGEVVSILADGATHPDKTVSSGSITLDRPASIVHVGLGYDAEITLLPYEQGLENTTTVGRKKRIHQLHIRLLNTIGCFAGIKGEPLQQIVFRDPGDEMNIHVPLFTGVKTVNVDCRWARELQVKITSDGPLPWEPLNIGIEQQVEGS